MVGYSESNGTDLLRAEFVDKVVKGFAEPAYKFKQAVSISTTNAWKNTFYRENPDVLTVQSGNAVKGIPRGAAFPQSSVTWAKINTYVEKYGLEENLFFEDILTNDVDVLTRTIQRVTERVVKAVDDEIWSKLTTDTDIQTISIDVTKFWEGSSAAIIDDLMNAKQKIGEKNYNTSNLMCFISERDHRSIVNYLAEKGAQFPQIATEVINNGRVGKLAGVNLVVSNSVAASRALIVVPKICATWKQAYALTSTLVDDPYKSKKLRVVEMGTTQVTDPSAIVYISGTQD